MRLSATCARPPVEDVVNETAYCVRALAAADAVVLSTLTPLTDCGSATTKGAEGTAGRSDVVDTVAW
jgi:hypothetical protein